MSLADLYTVPYLSPAQIAGHNARLAEHYRALARAAEALAGEARFDRNEIPAAHWTAQAERFRRHADRIAASHVLEALLSA